MYNKFMAWLASGNSDPFVYGDRFGNQIIIRVSKNSQIDYLFAQSGNGDQIERGKSFEYAGLYYWEDGLLYDTSRSVFSWSDMWDDLKTRTDEALLQKLQSEVRAKVEEKIGNNRNNLTVSALSDSWLKDSLRQAAEYGAASFARDVFLGRCSPAQAQRISVVDGKVQTHFCCGYNSPRWTEDEMVSYITNSVAYVEKEAGKYMCDYQEEILLQFLCNDLLQKEYNALLADEKNPVHIIRRIMDAVNSAPAKTVNVSIVKEGTELTMKVPADDMRMDPGADGGYNDWHIMAQDRKKFRSLFGDDASYKAGEIVQISYGKKVLYTR